MSKPAWYHAYCKSFSKLKSHHGCQILNHISAKLLGHIICNILQVFIRKYVKHFGLRRLNKRSKLTDRQHFCNHCHCSLHRISLLAISIGCACGTFVLAGYLFRHRRVKVFKVASPIFLMITLIGCAIMYLEVSNTHTHARTQTHPPTL